MIQWLTAYLVFATWRAFACEVTKTWIPFGAREKNSCMPSKTELSFNLWQAQLIQSQRNATCELRFFSGK